MAGTQGAAPLDNAAGDFTRSAPAAHIEQLLAYLESHNNGHHYFRGQTRYYDVATPSSLRSAIESTTEDKSWIHLSTDLGERRPARLRAKTSLRQALLIAFGKVVGDLLCQQYGIASDAFDISNDPRIAGFFATHTYPSYAPHDARDKEDVGVVYRFTINTATPPPLAVMERTLRSLYLMEGDNRRKIWFDEIASLRTRLLSGQFKSYEKHDLEQFLSRRFPDGFVFKQLFRSVGYLSYDMIESVFVERADQLGIANGIDLMRSSRTFRQQGGLYFPPSIHSTFVSRNIRIAEISGNDFSAAPGIVETMGAQRVFNMNANPNVERFYFRHNSQYVVHVDDLSALWPSQLEDGLLSYVYEICERYCDQYLKKFNTTPLDFENGLIDPGYLSGFR